MMRYLLLILCIFCQTAFAQGNFEIKGTANTTLLAEPIATFNEPWAMEFLPDDSILVTEKNGKIFRFANGKKIEIANIDVAYGGQGGLGDIIAHPNFANNNLIYFSHAIKQNRKYKAIVKQAELNNNKLKNIKTIWQQQPATSGRGHYGHKLLFDKKNNKLFITSGDRQKLEPAQDFNSSLGKIIRLNPDGTIPTDNPWSDGSKGELAKTFWSLGHRNPLGIAFDAQGKLWINEMGPRHGDELNLIERGKNYGWPIVSEGNHYSGRKIPNHNTRPEFTPPILHWIPSIAPSSMIITKNSNAFIGGLVSRALIKVKITQNKAIETERFKWGKRIREIAENNNGTLWVLEDRENGRLLKLTEK